MKTVLLSDKDESIMCLGAFDGTMGTYTLNLLSRVNIYIHQCNEGHLKCTAMYSGACAMRSPGSISGIVIKFDDSICLR